MKFCRIIVIFIAVVFIFGCATSSKKINKITLGMTKQEVIEIIGEPNSTSAKKNVEIIRYRLAKGCFYKTDYSVKLLDGKVDAYGEVGDFGLTYSY
jgi:hypothetical protein